VNVSDEGAPEVRSARRRAGAGRRGGGAKPGVASQVGEKARSEVLKRQHASRKACCRPGWDAGTSVGDARWGLCLLAER
jgi:hypothetical protein